MASFYNPSHRSHSTKAPLVQNISQDHLPCPPIVPFFQNRRKPPRIGDSCGNLEMPQTTSMLWMLSLWDFWMIKQLTMASLSERLARSSLTSSKITSTYNILARLGIGNTPSVSSWVNACFGSHYFDWDFETEYLVLLQARPNMYEHNNKPESRYETCESLPKYSPKPPDINALSAPSFHLSAAENSASENAGRITLIRVKVVGREFHANSKDPPPRSLYQGRAIKCDRTCKLQLGVFAQRACGWQPTFLGVETESPHSLSTMTTPSPAQSTFRYRTSPCNRACYLLQVRLL